MNHTQRDIWKFLKKNGVLKIRRHREYFQFLINTDKFDSDSPIEQIEQPKYFFAILRNQTSKRRPKNKTHLGLPNSKNASRWNQKLILVDRSSPTAVVYGYKVKIDMDEDAKIVNRLIEINKYEAYTYDLLNLILFGQAKIPTALSAPEDISTPTANQPQGPKYVQVKRGVNQMLESLRAENPGATLDEAKRIYANQSGDTYGNVNKLYHYKGK